MKKISAWFSRPLFKLGRFEISPFNLVFLLLFQELYLVWLVMRTLGRWYAPGRRRGAPSRDVAGRSAANRRFGPEWRAGDPSLGYYDAGSVANEFATEPGLDWSTDSTPAANESLSSDDAWGGSASALDFSDDSVVNPATGLMMVGGTGGVDSGGNPYGSSHDDLFDTHHSFGDAFDSFGSDFSTGFDHSD